MHPDFQVRLADKRDLPKIMNLLNARVQWLRDDLHSDQWADVEAWQKLLVYLIQHGLTRVVCEQDTVLGTITVSREPDLEFWSEHERARPALYVSKLATAPDAAGRGLGRFMLDWAIDLAEQQRVEVVRLDAWRDAHDLHQYYKNQGWHHIRTEAGPRRSGALFAYELGPLTKPLSIPELYSVLELSDTTTPERRLSRVRRRAFAPWRRASMSSAS